jgi:chorismate synthase
VIDRDPERGWLRKSNRAGGIEGGMSNGEPILLRCAAKPIPTLMKPLPSVDLVTKEPVAAGIERSDVCVVPAAGVVGEAMVALVLADAFLEKFGGDSVEEIERNYRGYLQTIG